MISGIVLIPVAHLGNGGQSSQLAMTSRKYSAANLPPYWATTNTAAKAGTWIFKLVPVAVCSPES